MMISRGLQVVTEEVVPDVPDEEADLPFLHAQIQACGGQISYYQTESGFWHCRLQVPTPRPGLLAEVKSEFDLPTLSDAIRQCLDRIRGDA